MAKLIPIVPGNRATLPASLHFPVPYTMPLLSVVCQQYRRFAARLTLWFMAVLIVTGSMPGFAQSLPTLGDTEREELSPRAERKLGERIMEEIRRDPDYLDDAPLSEYLNALGEKLVAARPDARGEANFAFSFFAVRDPVLNAFALPGGFIAVHSGLVLAAQSESELASVMAHEIGHVAQRHIARMLGRQRQDALLPLAGLLLAVLASKIAADGPAAVLFGTEALAIQRQLNFSRDAEREADRVGLQILQKTSYDTSGMVAFFGRLQAASRTYNDVSPSFLRTHPLTSERIADIQGRISNTHYRQRIDSLEFQLIRARVRILQDGSVQGLRDGAVVFSGQRQIDNAPLAIAGAYGLALVALRQHDLAGAARLLQETRTMARYSGGAGNAAANNALFESLAIDICLAGTDVRACVGQANAGRQQFSLSRGIALQYASALIAARQLDQAVLFLREQALLYRNESKVQAELARAYAEQGRVALQHLALAESYALSGHTQPALDQLLIARRAADATYYEHSVIDARERSLQELRREEIKEEKTAH